MSKGWPSMWLITAMYEVCTAVHSMDKKSFKTESISVAIVDLYIGLFEVRLAR